MLLVLTPRFCREAGTLRVIGNMMPELGWEHTTYSIFFIVISLRIKHIFSPSSAMHWTHCVHPWPQACAVTRPPTPPVDISVNSTVCMGPVSLMNSHTVRTRDPPVTPSTHPPLSLATYTTNHRLPYLLFNRAMWPVRFGPLQKLQNIRPNACIRYFYLPCSAARPTRL